jgi:progesterone-induced-blocking factor 1
MFDNEKKSQLSNSKDNQKLYYELADTKALLQQANYKRDDYDRVKAERDDFERKMRDFENKSNSNETHVRELKKKLESSERDNNQFKQETLLLRQDKDYLHKQMTEAVGKVKQLEDKLDLITKQCEETKKSRDELYTKQLKANESIRAEYDANMSRELEKIKQNTNLEVEKLRANTKEFYEREIRGLKEEKQSINDDKERLLLNEREMNAKYQEVCNEIRLNQIAAENQIADLKSELKLRSFEKERMEILNEENIKNYQEVIMENEKLKKKLEIFQKEYYSMQNQNDKKLMELESELNEKRTRLDSYERVEEEMDSILRQVAEKSGDLNDNESEKLLSSYGYGSNIIINSKRRLQQNVNLTKRILKLEQLNTTLRHDLTRERQLNSELKEKIEISQAVIENTKQPHEFLVRSIQSKEVQIRKQQKIIDKLQNRINETIQEQDKLIKKKNEMSIDIERLLRHNDELLSIQDFIKKDGNLNFRSFVRNSKKSLSPQRGGYGMKQPSPMIFTSIKK